MDQYWPLVLFVISASVTPGPNNVMIMSSGVNYGVKKSLPHLFGIAAGFTLMVFLAGIGFGSFFIDYPLFHDLIKFIGTLYLLFLAWMIATTSNVSLENQHSKPFSFLQAALFQWVNPKAWVMITGAVALFISGSSNILSDVLLIAFSFFLFGTPCVCIWLFFGVGLKKYMTDPVHLKRFNVSMALLLVLSILPAIKELVVSYIL